MVVVATPEGNAELRARFEQLLGEYERVRANITTTQDRMRRITGTATSLDYGIRVTVGPRGNMVGLEIEPRAYRRLSPSELAEEILRLAGKAGKNATEQMQRVMAPLLPKGMNLGDILNGDVSPETWAPKEPLTNETFDEWWATIGQPVSDEEGEKRA